MLDRLLLPTVQRLVAGPARELARRGVSADAVTLTGFAIGLGTVPLLANQAYGWALFCLLINRTCDGVDGAVARIRGPTDRGAFLDIALDFFVYAAVPFGFALADPAANAPAAAALLLAFVGTGSSFLAFAVLAERRRLANAAYPSKGLYYLGGLTEGSETIACFTAMCLWPAAFPWLAWSFAGLCLITTVARWRAGWQLLAERVP